MKPILKAPGNNLLTLEYDEPLSNFAFKFNLRRWILVVERKRLDDLMVGRCR